MAGTRARGPAATLAVVSTLFLLAAHSAGAMDDADMRTLGFAPPLQQPDAALPPLAAGGSPQQPAQHLYQSAGSYRQQPPPFDAAGSSGGGLHTPAPLLSASPPAGNYFQQPPPPPQFPPPAEYAALLNYAMQSAASVAANAALQGALAAGGGAARAISYGRQQVSCPSRRRPLSPPRPSLMRLVAPPPPRTCRPYVNVQCRAGLLGAACPPAHLFHFGSGLSGRPECPAANGSGPSAFQT